MHVDIPYDVDNPFIDAYLGSIKKARDVITDQWSESTWDKKKLEIQAPSTSDEVFSPHISSHFFIMIMMCTNMFF